MQSRSDSGWVKKIVVTVIFGALVTWVFTWAGETSKTVAKHDTAIEVMKDNISTINNSQQRIEDKLDRVLERRK